MGKDANKTEYGDFQTPSELAVRVCERLVRDGVRPGAVVEPTCGVGGFLLAAARTFADSAVLGFEIQPMYVEKARQALHEQGLKGVTVEQDDFFRVEWSALLNRLPKPVLLIGNPPWVTNSTLGTIGGSNLPAKTNFQSYKGLDALTGKANFDISEWMLIHLLEVCGGRDVVLAMLVKTAVARRVLSYAWRKGMQVGRADMRLIDAKRHFNASVAACLLVVRFDSRDADAHCRMFASLDDTEPESILGWRDGSLIADVPAYEELGHLQGASPYQWRSGIKHDCSKVMEFRQDGDGLRNGLGEVVKLEQEYLYPMLKTSDVANGRCVPTRWMLVPQRAVGEDTARIAQVAPRTWRYLQGHADILNARGSSIYRNRPPFSVFGVGEYSFASWKVAISGFYSEFAFRVVGPHEGKPVVLDDASYSVACGSEAEACLLAGLLNGEKAQRFFRAFVFWDGKRPVTTELLRRLNVQALADECGEGERMRLLRKGAATVAGSSTGVEQMNLFG